MNYDYNGNLREEDRINIVASDIIIRYPQIRLEEAREIASLEGAISEEKNSDMEFNRLYNIIFVIQKDIKRLVPIYSDLVSFIHNHMNSDKIVYYCSVVGQIAKYLKKERDFPYLTEFAS